MKRLSRVLGPIGYCQRCHEPLTRADVLGTGQAKECARCHQETLRGRLLARETPGSRAEAM